MSTFIDRVIDLALAIEDGHPLVISDDLIDEVARNAKDRALSPVLIDVLTDVTAPEVVRLRAMVILTIRLAHGPTAATSAAA